jgi:hypothetical protein
LYPGRRLLLERRIVRVAGRAVGIEGLCVPGAERAAEREASRQARRGDFSALVLKNG